MISKDNWRKYIDRLAAIDKRAADQMQEWIDIHGLTDTDALIEYAYGLVSKYGEASATLSCDMYDYMADLMDADVPEAIPAETATINEVARGVTWGKYHSPSQIPSVVSRQVRQTGADTMIQNAKRDNAEWAWVPQGDTCAFCITLASRGWQNASKTILRGNHAEHIHQNCDCTFAIAFKPSDKRQYDAIYDPQKYKDMYYSAEGDNPGERINSLRKRIYSDKKSANAGPITRTLNNPGISNSDEVVDRFMEKIEVPEDNEIIKKVRHSAKHMPVEDLEMISSNGLIVERTSGKNSYENGMLVLGEDGQSKHVIRLNPSLGGPFAFAHECAHMAEEVNEIYHSNEFIVVLDNLKKHIDINHGGVAEFDGNWYYIGISDLFIEPYQGRTYVKDYGRDGLERRITIQDFVEYISVGYECFIGDPKIVEDKDPVLYNYFVKRGLR